MKYIMINDLLFFFRKFYKFVISFIICILGSLFVRIYLGFTIDKNLLMDIVGLNNNFKNMFTTLMFLINLGMHLLIIFQIFNNDIINGNENIFLRITTPNWVKYKYISIIILNAIMRLLIYVPTLLIFYINNVNLFLISMKYLALYLMFVLLIDFCFLNIYIIINKCKYILPIIVLICVLLINKLIISVDILEKNIGYILLVIVFLASTFYYILKDKNVDILR